MPVTGDFAALNELKQEFAKIPTTFRSSLLKNVAEEARRQVVLGFEQERDPYGNPWEPLKVREGRILQDTGRMRNAFTFSPTADGFVIRNPTAYVAFHEDGTSRIPQRMMVPPNGDLPPLWERDVVRVIDQQFHRTFGR